MRLQLEDALHVVCVNPKYTVRQIMTFHEYNKWLPLTSHFIYSEGPHYRLT